jgi:hypothetical protein
MAIKQDGSNIVVSGTVAGSVFPASERDLAFPVLVDGAMTNAVIEGALYGRSVELRGDVWIKGPVVVRGDIRLNPGDGRIQLDSGLTVNGGLNCVVVGAEDKSLQENIQNASLIIKGDLAVNQNVSLQNAIVFGSVKAVNCTLDKSVVLGTCIVDEVLKVSMSSIGGYASRDVTFEGSCLMLHALGESRSKPLFMPREVRDSAPIESDLRYYPAIRKGNSIINRSHADGVSYPEYSKLFPAADWVQAEAHANPALDERGDSQMKKWILSIGGRISDISKISDAIANMTKMLKCGFEYEHYSPAHRHAYLQRALPGLTDDEAWILKSVCR